MSNEFHKKLKTQQYSHYLYLRVFNAFPSNLFFPLPQSIATSPRFLLSSSFRHFSDNSAICNIGISVSSYQFFTHWFFSVHFVNWTQHFFFSNISSSEFPIFKTKKIQFLDLKIFRVALRFRERKNSLFIIRFIQGPSEERPTSYIPHIGVMNEPTPVCNDVA